MSHVLFKFPDEVRRISALHHDGVVYWWAYGPTHEVVEGATLPDAFGSAARPETWIDVKGLPVAFCPVVRPGARGEASLLRCFVTQKSGSFEIGYFEGDYTVKRIATFSSDDVMGVELAANSFGLFVLVTRTKPSVLVELLPIAWEELHSVRYLVYLHPPALPPEVLGPVHGICTNDKRDSMWFKLVAPCKIKNGVGWAELDVNIVRDHSRWQVNESAWAQHAAGDVYVMEPTLLWGPDGALQMLARSALPTDYDVALRRYSSVAGWTRSDTLRVDGARALKQALPTVMYVPGSTATISGDAGNAIPEVDVQRWTLFPLGRGENVAVFTDIVQDVRRIGKARRRTLGTVPGQKKVLIGIIEGPPPVPEENLNLAPGQDKSSASAETTLSDQTSQTSTMEFSASEAAIFDVKGEVGWIFSGSSSFALNVAHTHGAKHTVTTTLTQAFKHSLKQEQKDGRTAVQPLGTAIVLGVWLTGFEFEFLDEQGRVINDAPQMRQILPQRVGISVRPYLINPKYSPVPGKLETYVADTVRLADLNRRAMPLADGATQLGSSWSVTGTSQQTVQKVKLDQFSRGFAIDLKLMLGFKAEFLGQRGEISGGFQLKLSGTWTSTDQDTRTLSTSVSIPGSRDAFGTYYSYNYDTYLLQPNKLLETEFMERLVTPDWPMEGHDRDLNQGLRDDLAPGGTDSEGPWMITYTVTERHRVELLTAWLEKHERALEPALALRLRDSGAATTADLVLLAETGALADGDRVKMLLQARGRAHDP